jgi:subtilisin family serine protease
VRLINLSVTLNHSSRQGERDLKFALDKATGHGVIIVAAAGNHASIGSSAITRHPGVIPVVAYDRRGQPMAYSNLGASIGKWGIGAPGDGVTSLGVGQNALRLTGTSAAAPFVTGLIALLLSLFPDAHTGDIRSAITRPHEQRRATVVPPLLNGGEAFRSLTMTRASMRGSAGRHR